MPIQLKAIRHVIPPPRVCTADWLESHTTMPAGTETSGQPFSLAAFPHVRGVLEAFDNPATRIIVLQWGTRLGKTTTCLSILAKAAACNPRNAMFAGPTKESVGRVVSSRLYPLLESTEIVKDQLLAEHRRSKLDVRLEACRIFVGWSGSENSLADVGAAVGVASEIDKWDGTASNEADSLSLYLNRFKGFPSHSVLLESTPTITGRSRIEQWMSRSNQHTRHVPCPLCGEFQRLVKGSEQVRGGIKWHRDKDGNSDADLAFRTAFYECAKCHGRIDNHHRVSMLRKGVWVPEGCSVRPSGQIVGKAEKAGSDVVGFGPLPSWYALTETWGGFARAWIRARNRPRDLQDVVNSYCAETWAPKKSKSVAELIGQRITGQTPRGIVPDGVKFLTVTIDRQAADGGHVVFVVLAHGDENRVWLVQWGTALKLADLWNPVCRAVFPCADGTAAGMTPVMTMVDSGWNTKDTYEFCQLHPGVVPCKGSSTDLGGLPYRIVNLQPGATSKTQQVLVHVGTDFWETDVQTRLDDRLAGEPGSLTLAAEARNDLDLLRQLCNADLKDAVDTRGNAKLCWVKKEELQPNDYRDCVRYGLCLGRAWVQEFNVKERRKVVLPSNRRGG